MQVLYTCSQSGQYQVGWIDVKALDCRGGNKNNNGGMPAPAMASDDGGDTQSSYSNDASALAFNPTDPTCPAMPMPAAAVDTEAAPVAPIN